MISEKFNTTRLSEVVASTAASLVAQGIKPDAQTNPLYTQAMIAASNQLPFTVSDVQAYRDQTSQHPDNTLHSPPIDSQSIHK